MDFQQFPIWPWWASKLVPKGVNLPYSSKEIYWENIGSSPRVYILGNELWPNLEIVNFLHSFQHIFKQETLPLCVVIGSLTLSTCETVMVYCILSSQYSVIIFRAPYSHSSVHLARRCFTALKLTEQIVR